LFKLFNEALDNSDCRVSNECMTASNELHRPCEVTVVARLQVISPRWHVESGEEDKRPRSGYPIQKWAIKYGSNDLSNTTWIRVQPNNPRQV